MSRFYKWLIACLVLFPVLPLPVAAAAWEKLADPPRDVAGRESPPGVDGAWVYVPPWKGFLLYGGSPTHSNEGWFFDLDQRIWTLLWAHDALAHDEKGWRVLLPRDLVWSLDRPGPARSHGIVYDTQRQAVYFFGGFPADDHSKHFGPDPRLSRELLLGTAKLGTWSFDPKTAKFRHITGGGPAGLTRGVYDPVNDLIVAMPLRADFTEASKTKPGVTWVFDPKQEKWQMRSSANGPRAFPYSGFVYDSRAKMCVYYNGFGETWTYDAGTDTWEEKKPAQAPPRRRHAALCFDEARGVTILQAGVHHDRSGVEAFSLHKSHNATHHADTWCYDAVKNEWTELKPSTSPPRTSSSRCLAAYDPDRQAVVVYDVAVGVWAYRSDAPRVKAALPPGIARLPVKHQPPVADDTVRAWQDRFKNLKDNTWLDLGIPVPRQGCMNVSFDPVNHCLVMLGGCGGALFGTPDDFGYNNQVWLLDMQVGRYALRRAHQVWGPQDVDFRLTRMAPGCTRGNCFDATRNALWTAGGNGWSGVGTTHIRTYDVAADTFGLSGPPAPWGDGECGMFVHDPKHDVLVYVDSRRHQKTYLYDPKKRTWTDGGPCPLASTDETLAMFSARVYDPEIGVIAVVPGWKSWRLGDPRPTSKKSEDLAVRTFAYDVAKKQWRDLAPMNQDKVPYGGMLGVAYDSRNRQVLVLKSDHGDVKPLDTSAPHGTLWALDLARHTWVQAAPGPSERLNMASMTYDPRLNVVLCRYWSKGLWAYRCKGGCPPDAFGGK